MNSISVVLIAKNEAHIIADTIRSAKSISDDIVVVDSGSTDGTLDIVSALGVRLIKTRWEGFGPTKNKGIAAARYDWILSIDADEIPDETLVNALQQIELTATNQVFNIKFKTFLGSTLIRYGEWGNDAHVRLFNRQHTKWDDAQVHEQLVLPANTSVLPLKGYLLHYTMKDLADYATKMTGYALMNAERYFAKGRQANWVKRNLSPALSFIQNYVIRLGFLDGREGFLIAKMTAWYTFLKYARLYELGRTLKNK